MCNQRPINQSDQARKLAVMQALINGGYSVRDTEIALFLHPFWDQFILDVYEFSGVSMKAREEFSVLLPSEQIEFLENNRLLSFESFMEFFQKTRSCIKFVRCN